MSKPAPDEGLEDLDNSPPDDDIVDPEEWLDEDEEPVDEEDEESYEGLVEPDVQDEDANKPADLD